MRYRLAEGQGEAIYELGVEDDGTLRGLNEEDLDETIQTVKRLAAAQKSDTVVLRKRPGVEGNIAEVLVRRQPCDGCPEIRVAVAGNVDSGKVLGFKPKLFTNITVLVNACRSLNSWTTG